MSRNYILTESGICYNNPSIDKVIAVGQNVVNIARQCKALLESGKEREFFELMLKQIEILNEEEHRILLETVVTDSGMSIFEEISFMDDPNEEDDEDILDMNTSVE